MPLAENLRPKTLDEVIGQKHLTGENAPLRVMLESGTLTSMIFWGPPGCGKTTIARLVPKYSDAHFVSFSAVTGNIKEVRAIIAEAKDYKKAYNKDTILFVDEIHRFNKAQQDAFLPYVEDGTIILIGATTENPGFEVNAPLISRSQVYVFHALTHEEIEQLAKRVIAKTGEKKWDEEALSAVVQFAQGDARSLINAIETVQQHAEEDINQKLVMTMLQKRIASYDKKGDGHYDTISAFIKSMRGTDPDATLHYLARMIDAGEDPLFIARRMIIFASEDIGNARPNALVLATSTMQAVQMVGMPEAQLILAQCATYLATCTKSIASTVGIFNALADVRSKRLDPIPLHVRNAANKIMKEQGYGKGHIRYPWMNPLNKAAQDQTYLPKNLEGKKYYDPEKYTEK